MEFLEEYSAKIGFKISNILVVASILFLSRSFLELLISFLKILISFCSFKIFFSNSSLDKIFFFLIKFFSS